MGRKHYGFIDLGHGVGTVTFEVGEIGARTWKLYLDINDSMLVYVGSREYVVQRIRTAARRG